MAATPLITEVLQQLQSSNTGLWSPPTAAAEYVAANQQGQATANHQPKRLQVPKACSNCRKMHAGCDHVRPCKRCVQNGLEATCVDVPRKKRVSKKRSRPEDLVEVKHEQVAPSTPSLLNTALVVSTQQKIEDPNKMWEDTYNELFGGTIADQLQPPPRRGSLDFNPFSYQPDSYLLSEIPSSPLQYNRTVVTNMPPATPPPSQQPSNSYDFDYLLTQIRELHDSNKTLESKLMGVTNELIDMKKSPSIPNLLNPSGANRALLTGTQTGWHSFGSQQDVAVSLWKTTGTSMGNVLLECNSKFVQLLGYSLEVLGNNFNCTNMIRQQDLCGDKDNCKAWPKRTQIITATGLKDVLVTITPVQTGKDKLPPNTKYFLVNMTEPSD